MRHYTSHFSKDIPRSLEISRNIQYSVTHFKNMTYLYCEQTKWAVLAWWMGISYLDKVGLKTYKYNYRYIYWVLCAFHTYLLITLHNHSVKQISFPFGRWGSWSLERSPDNGHTEERARRLPTQVQEGFPAGQTPQYFSICVFCSTLSQASTPPASSQNPTQNIRSKDTSSSFKHFLSYVQWPLEHLDISPFI